MDDRQLHAYRHRLETLRHEMLLLNDELIACQDRRDRHAGERSALLRASLEQRRLESEALIGLVRADCQAAA